MGNVTGPDPNSKAAAWTAALRCAGEELANCIMIQSTNSAPSIALEVALATQRRLPAHPPVLQMHCLIPVAQRVSTESSSSVRREAPELCLCQSQKRLISSIFCSSAGATSSTILVMIWHNGIACCKLMHILRPICWFVAQLQTLRCLHYIHIPPLRLCLLLFDSEDQKSSRAQINSENSAEHNDKKRFACVK